MTLKTERDFHYPILEMLAAEKSGFLTTGEIIKALQDLYPPRGHDKQIIPGRADSFMSQKVRNIVCHRKSSTSPIMQGYIEYDAQKLGLRITKAGRELLARRANKGEGF